MINRFLFFLGRDNQYKIYSSIFRVFAALLILKEVVQLWLFVPIIYQQNSFFVKRGLSIPGLGSNALEFLQAHIYLLLGCYVIFLIFYCFGFGKRITALFVFLIFNILQRLCPLILNGGDNLLTFILMYLIFIDSYSYLSLKPLNYKTENSKFLNNLFSNIFGFCICIHISLVYLITSINKIHSDVWFHGIAVYYTLQIERFKGTSINSFIANNAILVTLMTYYTLFVEMLYPTLVWFKKTKKWIICCAILMHIGIYIFMMIYDFQLIFIFVQGFFFTNEQWQHIIRKIINFFKTLNIPKIVHYG